MYFLDFLYGPASRTQRLGDGAGVSMETTLFSNVNAAIRRELFARYPFAEDMIMSEDQEWSRRVLLDGYELRYVADAAVRHSHDYTLAAAFRRFFDSGVSASRSYAGGEGATAVVRRRALDYARGELAWLWRSGQRAAGSPTPRSTRPRSSSVLQLGTASRAAAGPPQAAALGAGELLDRGRAAFVRGILRLT